MAEKVDPLLGELGREVDALARQGRTRDLAAVMRSERGRCAYGSQVMHDFSSADFFGVLDNRRLLRSAHEVLEQFGVGSPSPRLASGTTDRHVSCEAAFARFFGAQSALLFSSRIQATFTLLTSILGERDAVLIDETSSLPVVDAAYLVNATAIQYASGNLTALATELERVKTARRRFIIVETVSPVTAELVNALEVIELAQRHNAELIIDESTALGLVGTRGAGFVELCGPVGAQGILCRICDLGYALQSHGAVIVGPAILISHLASRSRTLLSEPVLPALFAAFAEASLHWIELQTNQRARNADLAQRVMSRLPSAARASCSNLPILSVRRPSLADAIELREKLLQRHIMCDAVPVRTHLGEGGMLRFHFASRHTDRVADSLAVALTELLPRNVPRGTF